MPKKVAVQNREQEDAREVLTARHVPIAAAANIVVPVVHVVYVVRKAKAPVLQNHWGVQQKALLEKLKIPVSAGL
ncbi:MAG TPA: hypothetical protein VLC98_10550 [Phnomibacter sp.]|nr:hypothetical protein [Phnomibacter sp.]